MLDCPTTRSIWSAQIVLNGLLESRGREKGGEEDLEGVKVKIKE